MHADYLNVTIPESHASETRTALLDLTGSLGGVVETPDLVRLNHGTLKMRDHFRGFTSFGMSGALLDGLRAGSLFESALHTIGTVPHRVTRLDVAHDLALHSPPVLSKLLRKARKGSVSLTRKALRPANIRFVDAYCHHAPGERTGSLYLGARTSEVRAIVYDKRNERIDRGFPDPGPLTRFELTVTGKLGATLRDATDPEPMYWTFMNGVLPGPANMPSWDPRGEGYDLAEPVALLPAEILRRKIETSPDIEHILELATRLGPHGMSLMTSMLERRARSLGSNLGSSDQDETA